jgi:hypothetical protein
MKLFMRFCDPVALEAAHASASVVYAGKAMTKVVQAHARIAPKVLLPGGLVKVEVKEVVAP